MKLATLLLGILLATTGTAAADEVLHPPGGPVPVSDPPPMRARGDLPRGDRAERAEHRQRARQLRRALVSTFDANGDGQLGPRERMRAVRVLRRIERRLAAGSPDPRGRAIRGAIRRHDLNRDGNLGPGELPPAGARRLRRLDGDRDGWVSPGEYR